VDAVRCYLLFLGPFSHGGDFRDTGMEGMARFLKRVWVMFSGELDSEKLGQARTSMLNETVKGITEDYEALRYNTVLAKLMTWYNLLAKQVQVSQEEAEVFVKLLAPLAPHMTEELWEKFGNKFSIHTSAFPTFKSEAIVHDVIKLAVQVNGKLRGVLVLDQNAPKEEKGIVELAKKEPTVAKFLEGKSIKKVIYIVGKIINFVVG
jgi:leucyl-tRNA synthetase